MQASDLLTLGTLAAMWCGFVFVGRSIPAFGGLVAVLVLARFWVGAAFGMLPPGAPDKVLLLLGMVLSGMGALVVRTFLLRSISLAVLLRPDADVEADLVAGFRRRPAEMQRYGLAVERDGVLHLTLFGRCIALLCGRPS